MISVPDLETSKKQLVLDISVEASQVCLISIGKKILPHPEVPLTTFPARVSLLTAPLLPLGDGKITEET